jgi:signal transduction histidine kinase
MSANQNPRNPAIQHAGPRLHPAMPVVALMFLTGCSAAVSFGSVEAHVVIAWLLASMTALLPELAAGAGLQPGWLGRWRDPATVIVSVVQGAVSGAAGLLFLAQLSPSARIALTVLACASVTLAQALRDTGNRYFIPGAFACLGQFALAWWLIGEVDPWLPGTALAIFGAVTWMIAFLYRQDIRRVHSLRIERDRLLEQLHRCAAIELEADRLVTAACHDLRQPVAAIALISALLRQKTTQSELAPALASLESGVAAINRQLVRIASIAEQIRPARIHSNRCTTSTDCANRSAATIHDRASASRR